MNVTLDFHISQAKQGRFELEIFARGSSQPLAKAPFEYDLSFMTDFEVSRLDIGKQEPEERLDQLQAFGSKLYQRLFVPQVKEVWQEYKERGDFLTLCLRSAPGAEKLEVLPWETLYDGNEFIAAGPRTSLIRLPLDIQPRQELPFLTLPLDMLALLSSPLDLLDHERLAIEKEQEILLRATNPASGQGRLKVVFEDEAKLPVIESALESPFRILHYSGHGIPPEYGGGLLLEDLSGKRRYTPAAEVLQTLEKGIKTVRLVVLCGCQTARTLYAASFKDLARALARRKVPAVLAMQFSISDSGGLLFAETLYPRIAEGQDLAVALSACRRMLLQSDDAHIQADALAPVLILSSPGPLKGRAAKPKKGAAGEPVIDSKVYLPLPQLGFGFYGRRREYREIRDGLLYKNQRAILVHGIGGIGKTALISHTAARLKDHFQGVYAFDCRSGTLAPDTILLELHRFLEKQGIHVLAGLLHESLPAEQLAVYLGQVLSQVRLLVIFDNFETQLSHSQGRHRVTDANLCTFLEMLIKTTSQASRFLFTSRYIFDLDEKRVGPVRYLALNDLSRPEALGLMQDLPHLAGASYEEKLAAYEVFGGHPYGLVTLERLCGHKSLAAALKDAAGVHQELREFLAIEINYSKISKKGRELLNRAAAFRRPVSWDALHWVMGKPVSLDPNLLNTLLQQLDLSEMPEDMQKMDKQELLGLFKEMLPEKRQAKGLDRAAAELVGWGLLTPIEEEGQVRVFAVHSLVRDFCRDKNPGSWPQVLADAASFYTNKSKSMPLEKKSLGIVLDEVEAAELLMEAGAWQQAASIIIKVHSLLDRWGFGRFLQSLYERLIPRVNQETRAIMIHNLGILLQGRGEYQAALEMYEKVLKIFEDIGDQKNMAAVLHQVGMIHQERGDYEPALEMYEKSLKIAEDLGDRAGIAQSLHQVGNIHYLRGDYDKALTQYVKALKIFEEIGDRADVAKTLHQVGNIHYLRGDYEPALKMYEKSLKIEEELGNRAGIARSLGQVGNIHILRGDYDQALTQYDKALKIFEELGDRADVAAVLHQLGMIHQERGDYEAALEMYEKSLKIIEDLGDRAGIAQSLGQVGTIHHEKKAFAQALDLYLQALTILARLQSPDAGIAMKNLIRLRKDWGAAHFDAAWQEKTGEPVPQELKEEQ